MVGLSDPVDAYRSDSGQQAAGQQHRPERPRTARSTTRDAATGIRLSHARSSAPPWPMPDPAALKV